MRPERARNRRGHRVCEEVHEPHHGCDEGCRNAHARQGFGAQLPHECGIGEHEQRLGDQRAKRLLFTGDCLSGTQAHEWGLAVEAPPADELDDRTEALLERIARMPINQLVMAKLALNSALLAQGVANSGMISTVFDGISRHTREGYAFQQRAATVGFRDAVRERDEINGDWKRAQFRSPTE